MAYQKKDEKKRNKSKPPVGAKLRRHLSVVGGTNTSPSLREARRRGNPQQRSKAQQEGQMSEKSPHSSISPSVTHQKKKPGHDLCTKVQEHWKDNDGLRKKTMLSDVVVRASDGERFHCNSFMLAVWSKRLVRQARREKRRSEKEEWVIDLECSGEILRSALRFMYGGPNTAVPAAHLPEIVTLANNYEIDDLKRACFTAAVTAPLKIGDACAMWLFADENNLPEAANRAMRFIYKNLEKVVKNPDWDRVSHNVNMLLQLLEASAEWTTVISDYQSVKVDDARDLPEFARGIHTVWRESNELSKNYGYSDKVLVSKSGRQFHVHSQIIYARSPKFASFLHEEIDGGDPNFVTIDDMDDDVVEEFLRYLYRQEPSIAFPKLASLVLVLATTYDVLDLMQMCEREMAGQQVTSIKGALDMLTEAEEHRMRAAKSACFRFLYANLAELRQNEVWLKLVHDEPQLIVEMMLESKRFRRTDALSECM